MQVFMVKRHAKSSFMPDVHVYPGGALDPQDCTAQALSRVQGLTPLQAQQRLGEQREPEVCVGLFLAGVRETFEEAGLLLARRAGQRGWVDLMGEPATAQRFAAHRTALRAGTVSLTQVLLAEDLHVPIDELGYFAHWITPYAEKRRFDARFFVARAPMDQDPVHDSVETVESRWVRPAQALALCMAGELTLAPPTLSTLVRLSSFERVEALMERAHAHKPAALLPHFEEREQGLTLLLPGDPDYPKDDPRYPHTASGCAWTRMVLEDRIWRIPGVF